MKEDISINYVKDNYFSELKEFEVLKDRLDMVSQIEPLVEQGYYSKEWIRKNILRQNDEDIEIMDKQVSDEKATEEPEDNVMAGTETPTGDLEADLNVEEDSLEDDLPETFELEEEI